MINKCTVFAVVMTAVSSVATVANATIYDEEYTYFNFTGQQYSGGFSYLDDPVTRKPILEREYPDGNHLRHDLFLQFEGLVNLNAIAGKTFTFGENFSGRYIDSKIQYAEWNCGFNSRLLPCHDTLPAGGHSVSITFDQDGLPTEWQMLGRFSYGDYVVLSSEEKRLPDELLALGVSSTTYFNAFLTQENIQYSDRYYFKKTTWTGSSRYYCGYDDNTLETLECSIADIGAIQPSVVPLPAGLPMLLAGIVGLGLIGRSRRLPLS
ncbi:hypothetical protein [uncultured Roseobacter sp.]|uniref:VPLPA-CTERM sorting domain-containing protein n=1 Tax=uncultured Roseobacter sp. TaxID=114847 RepID=UPI00263395E9|nr:hypothetical protein [uncultured Roseobacter sp.]